MAGKLTVPELLENTCYRVKSLDEACELGTDHSHCWSVTVWTLRPSYSELSAMLVM